MTDNALQTPHQFGTVGANTGYSHGIGPYNGIAGGQNAEQPHGSGAGGPAAQARPGMGDYTHQNPNSPYYSGQQPSPRMPPVGGTHPSGHGTYSKVGPGRPGWGTMPPASQLRFPVQGPMPMQQTPTQGSSQTPTLNQLLSSGPVGSDLRHPSGYPGSDYGPGGPMPMPNRGPDEFSGQMGFGSQHTAWNNQRYQQQMMQSQNMDGSRYDMARRANMQSGGAMAPRYPLGNQLTDVHASQQFSPNPQATQGPPMRMSNAAGGQQCGPPVPPSPSTTPQSQLSDQTPSSAHSTPPQQPQPPAPSKKSKKHHHHQQQQQQQQQQQSQQDSSRSQTTQQQESSSSDEVNSDRSASSRLGTGLSAASSGPQSVQTRPNSAYGIPTAPSPAGSVGSRSNTPASLQGNMIGSPSAAMHDVQNRIMSPVHAQGAGHQSQQMMPPPAMMPSHGSMPFAGGGPGGNMGKQQHPSASGGMMHMGLGQGGAPNQGPYTGGPMYGNQGPPGSGYGPAPNYPGHGMETFNGPNQMGPGYRVGPNYMGQYASSMDSGFLQGGPYPGPGSNMGAVGQLPNVNQGNESQSAGPMLNVQQNYSGKTTDSQNSAGGIEDQQQSTPKADQSVAPESLQQSGPDIQRGSQPSAGLESSGNRPGTNAVDNQNSNMDGPHSRRGMVPMGPDGMTPDQGMPMHGMPQPGMDMMHGKSGPLDGMPWRPSQQTGMESGMPGRNGPYMGMEGMPPRGGMKGMPYGMPGRPNQFMGMNGMTPRTGQLPFGPEGMPGRPGHGMGFDGMPGRPGMDLDGSAAGRVDQPVPVGPDGMAGVRPGPAMDAVQGRQGMDGVMYGRQGQPMPGMDINRPGHPVEGMMRRPPNHMMGNNGIDPVTGRPLPPMGMDGGPSRMSMQGMQVPVRPEDTMSPEDMQARMNQQGPGRFGMDGMPPGSLRPPMHPGVTDPMHNRPMQPMGMDGSMPGRFGSPMRTDQMDRRTGNLPDGAAAGSIPSQQAGPYGRPFQGYPNPPQPGMRGGFNDSDMVPGDNRMMDRNHLDPFAGTGMKNQMGPAHGGGPPDATGGQFGEFQDRRFAPQNGDQDAMKRAGEHAIPKMHETGESVNSDGSSRSQQCPDGRMDFNSARMNVGADGISDGMFHAPMSTTSSSRVAPSPAPSTQEEADSMSNASWPSTPKSGNNEVLNRLAEMGDEPDRRKMLERLFAYMEERSTPIVAVPTISKIAVDLYKLYHIVKTHGGMVEVTKNKKWRDVSSALNLGPSSSAGFTLKKNYGKHLFPFECRYDRGNIDPAPLLAFLEQPSKKESKKAAAERAAAAAAAQEGRTGFQNSSSSSSGGFQHGACSNNGPQESVGMPQYPSSGSIIPNGSSSSSTMSHHGIPPPSQASVPGDGPHNVQSPFSDSGSVGGPSSNYPRQNYVSVGPSSYDGRNGPYSSRQPSFGMGHQNVNESFDGHYINQDVGAGNNAPFPGSARFEQGPQGPGPYNYPGAQNRMDKFGPNGPYGPNQTCMPVPRPGLRPYFPDQPDGYGPSYGMHRGSQPWMPATGCQPGYGPVGSDQYRFASVAPTAQFNHSITPCLSPPSRSDHSSASIPPDRFQRPPSMFLARREVSFPPDSVEATRPNLAKLKRISHKQLGPVDPWRLLMSLKSGLLAESTWALDVLSVLLRDESTVLWFGLQHLPGLVDVLLEHMRRCLIDIFPGDFDELEISLESSVCSSPKSSKDKDKRPIDVKIEQVTLPSWMSTSEHSRRMRCVQSVDSTTPGAAGLKVAVDNSALTDDKSWDVYGEIDSSLLDWQMGRGDTSVHIQTTFSREASLNFSHELFFGSRSGMFEATQQPKLDRFDSFSVGLNRLKSLSSTDVAAVKDDKIPVLTSATCDIGRETCGDEAGERGVALKLEPPDIIRDTVAPKLDSKTDGDALDGEATRSSYSLPPPSVDEFTEERGIENLKRKWSEELEEDTEAYERDVQSLFVASDAQIEMSRRCLSISNVLRGLSFVPGNDGELARHAGLLAALGRLLLLGHRHPREARRRVSRGTSTEEDDGSNSIADDDTPILAATMDRWRWDTVDVLREDTLVIFANISGQLDLAAFPEEICIPVLDGLLHWASCSAACALDPLPSTPAGNGPSARRLALEALCKLCVTDANVDLVLATPPFRRVVCLLDDLVSILADVMSDQVAREFAVVLSSSLAAADASAARAIALRRSAISAFLGFIEAADRHAQQLVQAPGQQGHQMLRDNPEMMGTSIDMLRRAASVVRAIAETSDCRSSLFSDHQQRLLQLSMSSTLDSSVSSVIADVLFLCS